MDKKEFQVKLIYYGRDTSTAFNGYKVVSIKGSNPVIRVDMDDSNSRYPNYLLVRAGDLLDEREASMLGNHAVLTCMASKPN